MRKLKLEVQVSIDGYMADAEGKTNWMVWNWTDDWKWDDDLKQYHIDLTTSSDCILLSRKMAEEGFVNHWENVAANPLSPQHVFAKPITEMQKVVFSKTLHASRWRNTNISNGDFVAEVSELKSKNGKDIIVYGGATFVSSLIKAGLIDEFHLFVNPTILGRGISIFNDLGKLNLSLIESHSYNCGVAVLKYTQLCLP